MLKLRAYPHDNICFDLWQSKNNQGLFLKKSLTRKLIMFTIAIILNVFNGVHFVYQNPRIKTAEQKKNIPPRNDAPVKQRSFAPDISIRIFRNMFMNSFILFGN